MFRNLRYLPIFAVAVLLPGCSHEPSPKLEHPRLLLTKAEIPALKEKISQGWLAEVWPVLMAQADACVAHPVTAYGGEGSENKLLKDLLVLGLAGHLTGEKRFFDAGIRSLCAISEQMDPDADYAKEPQTGFKKVLSIGTMATALAIGYDLMAPAMTPEQRELVRREVAQYGACIYRRSQTEVWGGKERNHLAHNWNGVIHSGLGLCALALDDHPEWLELATERIKGFFMLSCDANGATWESVAYMNYGLMNAAPFSAALQRLKGRDLIMECPPIQQLPCHVAEVQLPWGGGIIPLNQGGGADGWADFGGFLYILSRTKDPESYHAWLRLMEFGIPPQERKGYAMDASSLAPLLLWGDPEMKAQSPADAGAPLFAHYPERGLAIMRTGWGAQDALASLGAGEGIQGCWNHADNNAFTFSARGEEFAIDRGSQRIEGRKHLKIMPQDHNVILVDNAGYKFIKGWHTIPGRLIEAADHGDSAMAAGDVSEAYETPFRRAHRQIVLVRGPQPCLLIVDDIQKDDAEHRYSWLMHTRPENTILPETEKGAATIIGARKNGVCNVKFLWPRDVSLRQVESHDKTDKAVLQADAKGINPRFVALLTAHGGKETPVRVESSGDPDSGMTIRLIYADGTAREIVIRGRSILVGKLGESEGRRSTDPDTANPGR